jgi:hypothetical protein
MRLLAILLVVSAACTDHKKPVCNYATPGADIADIEYRNPQDGQCQSFGTSYPCDPQCGQECPEDTAVGEALPDWGMCGGACESLSEAQCLASTSCHAAYQDNSAAQPTYWGCWELPPSGAITGSCSGLDSQTCSEHTDCVSTYTGPVNSGPDFVPAFETCSAKSTSTICGGSSCATGTECVVTPTMPMTEVCEPAATAGSCDVASCNSPPPGCPTGTQPGVSNGCYTNYCIPTAECMAAACSTLTESQCLARSDCDAVYMGSNCTCDRNGCVCQTETYQLCQ